ncbi:uncharacterized protein A4U43_C10F6380 [Asparagus officinalis]|uniref:Uncharacterized protein n=1 Tax=Asparagus officinalis TaxID=4686 RepID=A0A5P1E131_ASPOF|nr:uncharacterized protein A4U43_C10F6380 [Asparagus officinalis]
MEARPTLDETLNLHGSRPHKRPQPQGLQASDHLLRPLPLWRREAAAQGLQASDHLLRPLPLWRREAVQPMEFHKRRALVHFLERAQKPLRGFMSALEGVAGELMDSYQGLDGRWREERGRREFLRLMLFDGCFMLAVLRFSKGYLSGYTGGYASTDPIFSDHGMSNVMRRIMMDMVRIENQLPLFVLKKLVATETSGAPDGVLTMPAITVDDATECQFLNLMAFERLHVDAGNTITSYVYFMDVMVSAKDVAVLVSEGIIHNAVGTGKAVAELFNSLGRYVSLDSGSGLYDVLRSVDEYCTRG